MPAVVQERSCVILGFLWGHGATHIDTNSSRVYAQYAGCSLPGQRHRLGTKPYSFSASPEAARLAQRNGIRHSSFAGYSAVILKHNPASLYEPLQLVQADA